MSAEGLEQWKAQRAADVCVCGHRRDRHLWYLECGVDEDGYPCLCLRFAQEFRR